MYFELQEAHTKHEFLMNERIHETAYGNNATLGVNQHCDPERVFDITTNQIEAYRQLFYRPSNMVIAGVGVEHDELAELVEHYFGDMTDTAAGLEIPERAKSVYTGGQFIKSIPDFDFTRMQLAFPSAAFGQDDLYALSTAQMLLGGGDSFSAGGPGKGIVCHPITVDGQGCIRDYIRMS
jgi:processing peptidase subunit alpha